MKPFWITLALGLVLGQCGCNCCGPWGNSAYYYEPCAQTYALPPCPQPCLAPCQTYVNQTYAQPAPSACAPATVRPAITQ